jgi:hypothetical protein
MAWVSCGVFDESLEQIIERPGLSDIQQHFYRAVCIEATVAGGFHAGNLTGSERNVHVNSDDGSITSLILRHCLARFRQAYFAAASTILISISVRP